MLRTRLRDTICGAATRQTGATLVEVLVAIFAMAVGLLALLQLFPVGALEMARAINDDRTGAVAAEASALSRTGEDLVRRTTDFVANSLSKGSVDATIVAQLQLEYEDLAAQAANIQTDLRELETIYPPNQIQPHVRPLLAQIRQIEAHIDVIVRLLWLLTHG
jgi:Tfp pilus assembly protein PilV